jgi:hypothetical protein
MIELLFSSVNFALTLLVMLLVVYWLVSMLGGLDFDLDFDLDVDVDLDADFETGSSLETNGIDDASNVEVNKEDVVNRRRKPLKWWQIFLIYFNFVGLPFMFTFTCLVFFWWIISIVSTSFFNLYETQFGFLVMALSFFPALFVSKIFSNPFKSFFRKLNKDGDAPTDFIGRQGTSLSTISGDKMGNAEVIIDGNSFSIYIKTENGELLNYQDSFLIIGNAPDKSYFYVQAYKTNY